MIQLATSIYMESEENQEIAQSSIKRHPVILLVPIPTQVTLKPVLFPSRLSYIDTGTSFGDQQDKAL